jgi:HlyD family secretion protein
MKVAAMFSRSKFFSLSAIAGVLALSVLATVQAQTDKAASAPKINPEPKANAALTVNVTQAQRSALPIKINANGNIAPWQEAVVGTEANGLRLTQVLVNVGDTVKRGQVLATFAPNTVQADVAQIRASVAEAQATLTEATANAQRARDLQSTGALSAQQISQLLTAENTAKARLQAQKAAAQVQQLRLNQTKVLAPDFGVISSRNATVGAVLPAGQELFRMIVKNRLEWRAEVSGVDLSRIQPGMAVKVTAASGQTVNGKVRMVAPTVDAQTRNALVYVDLTEAGSAKAGMFAQGEFEVGNTDALTLAQSAVLLRDGFSYVLVVGTNSKVVETKVQVGRRVGERIEIIKGLEPSARVVASGGGFLADGDTVRVVESVAPAAKVAASK